MVSSSPPPMIVDFPSLPRQPSTTAEQKSVRFAGMCEMVVFKVHPVVPSQLWYSSEDRVQLLRQQRWESRMALTDSQLDNMTEDKISYCVGLEKALSPDHARRVKNHQRQHANIILSSQDVCTPELLSRISMHSSKDLPRMLACVRTSWQ